MIKRTVQQLDGDAPCRAGELPSLLLLLSPALRVLSVAGSPGERRVAGVGRRRADQEEEKKDGDGRRKVDGCA